MVYYRKADLEDIRKESGGVVELYAVYNHLYYSVRTISKLTKKYVYLDDGAQNPYPSKNAGYVIFDNKSEAWKYFKENFERRKKSIENKYQSDMESLAAAAQHLQKCSEETPEYFI